MPPYRKSARPANALAYFGPYEKVPRITSASYGHRLLRQLDHALAGDPLVGSVAAAERSLAGYTDGLRDRRVSKLATAIQRRRRGQLTRRLQYIPVLRAVKKLMPKYRAKALAKSKAGDTIAKLAKFVRGRQSRKTNTKVKLTAAKRIYQLRKPKPSAPKPLTATQILRMGERLAAVKRYHESVGLAATRERYRMGVRVRPHFAPGF